MTASALHAADARAAYIDDIGPADAIRVGDLPVPRPGPTDVLVEVTAAAVNHVDTYIRGGRYPTPMPFPFIVGRDLTGTVASAGPGTGFREGERVWCNSLGHGGRQGSCAEYCVVPADRLYRLPDGADAATAVAVFHPAATAFLALHGKTRVEPGDTILVGGAAGNVGSCAVQLAAEAGARVVATARTRDHQRCRELGAAAVLDFDDPELDRQILGFAPDGVDLFWDTSGTAELNAIMPLVRPGGRVLLTAGRGTQPPTPLWPFYTRDLSLVGFVVSRATTTELAHAARAINRRLAGPGLATRPAETFPLDETAAAHAAVEAGTTGRVVIRIRPDP
jgi:2-desacetyl-2-hydroxyethyl bacteriochlorophyllide A dehydrogenase